MINVQELTIGEVAGVINVGLIFGIRHPYFFVDATATNKFGSSVQITLPLLQALVLVGFLQSSNTAATWY